MRSILTICREYGQPPRWWDTLDRGDQVLLLADWRVRQREAIRAAQPPRGLHGRR